MNSPSPHAEEEKLMLPFRRDFNPARINRIVNDPSVFPDVALPGQESLDLSPIVGDLRNIVLMCDEGGIIAKWQEPGVYEIHTQFTERYRGVSAVRTIREMVSWLFLQSPAMELQSQVPEGNVGAEAAIRAVGARFEFERAGAWPSRDGTPAKSVGYYTLRYSDWLYQPYAAGVLAPLGEEFHRKLEEKKLAFLSPPEGHAEDPAHDLNVGATMAMIWAGQVDKAISLYARWARFAGYHPANLVSRDPLILDIGNALLLLNTKKEDFEILACKPMVI